MRHCTLLLFHIGVGRDCISFTASTCITELPKTVDKLDDYKENNLK